MRGVYFLTWRLCLEPPPPVYVGITSTLAVDMRGFRVPPTHPRAELRLTECCIYTYFARLKRVVYHISVRFAIGKVKKSYAEVQRAAFRSKLDFSDSLPLVKIGCCRGKDVSSRPPLRRQPGLRHTSTQGNQDLIYCRQHETERRSQSLRHNGLCHAGSRHPCRVNSDGWGSRYRFTAPRFSTTVK